MSRTGFLSELIQKIILPVFFPVLSGSHPCYPAEMLSHVALGRESQVRGNLDAAVVRVGKEILYEPDLRVDDILLQY